MKVVKNSRLKAAQAVLKSLQATGWTHGQFMREKPDLHEKFRNLITVCNSGKEENSRLGMKALIELAELGGIDLKPKYELNYFVVNSV